MGFFPDPLVNRNHCLEGERDEDRNHRNENFHSTVNTQRVKLFKADGQLAHRVTAASQSAHKGGKHGRYSEGRGSEYQFQRSDPRDLVNEGTHTGAGETNQQPTDGPSTKQIKICRR